MGVQIILFLFDPGIWFRIHLLDMNPNFACLLVGYEFKILSISHSSMLLDMNPNSTIFLSFVLLDMNPNFVSLFVEYESKFYLNFSIEYESKFYRSLLLLFSFSYMVLHFLLSLFLDFFFCAKFWLTSTSISFMV